jgi:hypothetical protein
MLDESFVSQVHQHFSTTQQQQSPVTEIKKYNHVFKAAQFVYITD